MLRPFLIAYGRDKQRKDRLNVERMQKSYGGKQEILHDTLNTLEHVYLGLYLHTIQPGDVQKMAFQDIGDSPFWMACIKPQSNNDMVLSCLEQRAEGYER